VHPLDQALRIDAVEIGQVFVEPHLTSTNAKILFSIAGAATISNEPISSVA
jgi:hypothetical protein